MAFVYQGSTSGLAEEPDWQAEIDQSFAEFGAMVGTAGDVNGDGYSDVIVGAPEWTHGQINEGGAWVYLGAAGGLSDAYGWHQESNQAGCKYGTSVGTAGDVNGDGWSDIIVGAPRFSNDQEFEGKAFVYHSSESGLHLTPDWTKEGNQAGASFGWSVGTAGDVNGDGFADVIVGAYQWNEGETDEGGAWVYHGAESGLDVDADWHAQGGQIGASFGTSVASAGDVNGDGYADVVVGAPLYQVGHPEEGQVFLFHGNGGQGASLALRQQTSIGHQPIAHLGLTDSDTFVLRMIRRNPFGRGLIVEEIETKMLDVRFTGENTYLAGGVWVNPVPGSTILLIVGPRMLLGTPYHWRMRVRYNPATNPFMPASRWVTIPWNGWNEQDLRTYGARLFLPIVQKH